MTIANQLVQVANAKSAIAAAIEAKGVTVGAAPFADYAGKIGEITSGGGNVEPAPVEWVRPADWLPLPEVLPTEQKFVGLYAVDDDDSNYVQILASGGYTVDWGDGAVESFIGGAISIHQYNYQSLPIETLSSHGYKQVVITLTPQNGQNITSLVNKQPSSRWLDMTIALPSATTITLTGGGANAKLLEQVTILSLSSSMNVMSYLFQHCSSIQSVPLFDTSNVIAMSSMFNGCSRLQSLPLLDTSSVKNMDSMFNFCLALQSVPLFDTSNATFITGMFSSCYGLRSVPLFNTSKVTNMSSMFTNCDALQSVPLFDTANVTSMSSMFNNCGSLRSVPLFNTSKVTNMSSMFAGCHTLQSVPLFDTANVTSMSGMFNACYGLIDVSAFNTLKVTSMNAMFQTCSSLRSIPLFNMVSVTTLSFFLNGCGSLREVPLFDFPVMRDTGYMFSSCNNLRYVPEFDMSTVTMVSSMFNGCSALSKSRITGVRYSVSYINCNLSADAINEVFTNLATVTGQTITITNNPGAATCDRTIATAKGWTVTG